jgi:putative PIN family toxin of toxin-antitoxin system
MIVVLDTNVIISALNFGSPRSSPVLAFQQIVAHEAIATCDEIDAELYRILTEKFDWPDARVNREIRHILARAIRVQIHGTLHLCRDPGDDKFLECAHRARVDLLITGDKDLLSLRSHGRTLILTPAAYLKL